MLSETLQKAMNDQIKHELYSAYLYLAVAAHFERANLLGFAHWMKRQSEEEYGHAMRFYEHIHDRGGRVILQAIDQPPAEFGSPTEVFREALAHEQKVTGLIHNLAGLAAKENDYASQNMLQWFVNEQVEEEKSAFQILEELRMVGDQGAGLFMIDRQLAAR
jgi:ferritin